MHRPCGDSGGTTKERYLEILEFTHFVEFFSFNKIGENHKEKILVQRVREKWNYDGFGDEL